MIAALLAGHVLAVLVMVYVATRDRSFAVEPDYYQKALHWDDIATARARNQRFGWKLTIDIGRHKSDLGEQTVSCRLSDGAGRPLEGALIDMVAFSPRAGQWLTTMMAEDAPGRNRDFLPLPPPGLWEFRLVVHHGYDVLTYSEQRQVQ